MTSVKPTLRAKSVLLKTARGRKPSSQRWLHRQLNDPYVQEAQAKGFRSRAAFKLIQLDEKFHFLKSGITLIDLGAAPGGWAQVAVQKINPHQTGGKVIGIDLLEIEPLTDALLIQGDFLEVEQRQKIKTLVKNGAQVVMSDMAASTIGHAGTDHLRTIALAEMAFQFAKEILTPGGTFISKVFQGGTDPELLKEMKQHFKTIKHMKPQASRKESPEMYVVALGFYR
ncbi:MAG: RlmE family RNA methyltransferase [Candidatus Paracaedimonas acanthamoebae]|uniref:Ribosomal RNA large subunit methyltransferase E n=1 Tax=Candidatus Paracaedimonas acanthamoebae TaxID=244581 RepID=A0A8J7TU66_9PROT|nr:RlmE family RNA methyltransferase [Candidatus Paracaedimonas acanthamoebae]